MDQADSPAQETQEAAAPLSPLHRQLLGAAGYVVALPRGDRAELRRMTGAGIPPEVFWRIVDRYSIAADAEPFWRDILPLMVTLPHRRGRRPGHALSRAGVKPSRVERWLRRDAEDARQEARRVFSAVDGGIDWGELGILLRHWSDPLRRRLARDFYIPHRQSEKTLEEGSNRD